MARCRRQLRRNRIRDLSLSKLLLTGNQSRPETHRRGALLAEKAVPREQPREASADAAFARTIHLAYEVLRTLAVDTKELAPGEMVGGQPARLADNGLGRPQAVVEGGRD